MAETYLLNEVFVSFFAALVITLATIPLLSWVARKFSLVDVPDEHRKLHQHAIPLVGGIAIFCATLLALGVLFAVRFGMFAQWSGWESNFAFKSNDLRELGGLLLGCLVLLIVGVLDDRFGLRGRQKLLGQFVACTILVFSGFQFESFEIKSGIGNMDIDFGSFAAIASYLWLLGAINSINLLDGADGFAGTVGGIMGVAFCIMALATGSPVDAAIFAAFTGAIVGFMRFNFPPAKIYLGDAGSMLIGLVIGALAIRCTLKQASAYAFFGPLALLTIPMLDTGAAIIRRRLTGRSIYAGDRAHLHHTLAAHGYGPRGSLLLVALLCSLTAAGGTLSVITHQSEFAVAAIGIVTVFLVANRIFGFAEFKLILSKFVSMYKSLKSLRKSSLTKNHHSAVQLQGRRDWQLIWHNVREFAEKYDFKTVKLHLHLPWLHEIYHARYDKSGVELIDQSDEWYFAIPLSVQRRLVGEIEVVAIKNSEITPYETLSRMMEMLSDLEPQFIEIIDSSDVEEEHDSGVDTIPLSNTAKRLAEDKSARDPRKYRLHLGRRKKKVGG